MTITLKPMDRYTGEFNYNLGRAWRLSNGGSLEVVWDRDQYLFHFKGETNFDITPEVVRKVSEGEEDIFVYAATTDFRNKIYNLIPASTFNSIMENAPKIYLASQAVEDPSKISFFSTKLKAVTWLRINEFGNSEKGREYRRNAAVMTRPGKYFAKFGINNPQLLEELTADFQAYAFVVIEGEDIRKYYLGDNYTHFEDTALHNSCMKKEDCQPYFDYYVENNKMVVAFDSEENILGRAILWENLERDDGGPITLLDRIYGINVFQHALKKYAREQGWWHKDRQDYSSHRVVVDPNGESHILNLKHSTGKDPYEYMPYMDTMAWREDNGDLNNCSRGRSLDDLGGNPLVSHICIYCNDNIMEDDIFLNRYSEDVCQSCFEEYCITCYGCGEVAQIEDTFCDPSTERNFCLSCVYSLFSDCRICGERILNEDLKEVGISLVCPECVDQDEVLECPKCLEKIKVSILMETTNGYCEVCELLLLKEEENVEDE